jgi:hypothetical protein
MPDLDFLAPNYRRAQQRWPDAPTLGGVAGVPEKAEDVAERLVAWLRVQAPEVGSGIPMSPAVAEGGLA